MQSSTNKRRFKTYRRVLILSFDTLQPASICMRRILSIANGLGMKVTHVLAGQLGGSLTAGANPAGKGACLTVTFPNSNTVA